LLKSASLGSFSKRKILNCLSASAQVFSAAGGLAQCAWRFWQRHPAQRGQKAQTNGKGVLQWLLVILPPLALSAPCNEMRRANTFSANNCHNHLFFFIFVIFQLLFESQNGELSSASLQDMG
jgi:hypothetical protein